MGDKTSYYSLTISKIMGIFLSIFAFVVGIYNGAISGTSSDFWGYTAIGFVSGLFILLTFLLLDISLVAWDKTMTRLSKLIRKHPHTRQWIIIPSILLAFCAAYLVLIYLDIDLSARVLLAVYLILFFPSATISLIRDDLIKERTRLSDRISRETRIHNPQAAIENAFTHFEDHLLKRVSGDSNLYGSKLIKAAYEGDKSKLVYKSDGKDHTGHLYSLMSGAYSLFRTPRHHKIIEDDEQKAQSIISLAELLMEFVDNSEEREIPSPKS